MRLSVPDSVAGEVYIGEGGGMLVTLLLTLQPEIETKKGWSIGVIILGGSKPIHLFLVQNFLPWWGKYAYA